MQVFSALIRATKRGCHSAATKEPISLLQRLDKTFPDAPRQNSESMPVAGPIAQRFSHWKAFHCSLINLVREWRVSIFPEDLGTVRQSGSIHLDLVKLY